MAAPRTLYDKIWDSRVVERLDDGRALLYVDRHLLDEHASAPAFDGLRARDQAVRRPDLTLAVCDHNAPTRDRRVNRAADIADDASRRQIDALERNAATFGVPYIPLDDVRQGITHIVGPEQGLSLPGTVIVGGDSHACTHGAFGALGLGIGTSEIEHVLATQTLVVTRARTMRVAVEGALGIGVSAKDLMLALTGAHGTAAATGHVVEYTGGAIRALSLEARMTVCNLSVELGARAGLIAPDRATFAYLQGRAYAPPAAVWPQAVAYWRTLRSDPGARFDREIALDARDVAPHVTWGTSPQDGVPITGRVPDPAHESDPDRRRAMRRSLDYMGLAPGTAMTDIAIDRVFIGSCTNGRIEDLRAAAAIVAGRRVARHVGALVVPGSGLVKAQAEREGLDAIFRAAGFDWRAPGCSMCLAMNDDRLAPGERCAATSNRNFEGRQGFGGRTHLVSPAMAAAAAISGRLADVRALVR
jgi:3-isopropylmalate/(R)-2-methylmalate dehydratase large subunit